MPTLVGEAIVAGLGLGSVYAIVAVSYTLVVAASGVFNFAMGSMVMLGGFGLLGLWQELHWPFLLACGIVLAGGGLLGVASYLLAVGPVLRRTGSHGITEGTLVTTFGLGLVIASASEAIAGDQQFFVNSYVSATPLRAGSVPIRPVYIAMFATCIVVAVLGELAWSHTRLGLRLRAIVLDHQGAALIGIPVERLVLVAFGVGGGLAGIAGLLMAPVTGTSVFVGTQFALYGFVAMAIGGYGSFRGAVSGGIVVGLVTSLLGIEVSSPVTTLVLFGLLVVFLILRPRGLFGRAGAFGSARLREV